MTLVGTALAVGVRPDVARMYVLSLEYGDGLVKLMATRDDSYVYTVLKKVDKLDVENVVKVVDELAKMIIKGDELSWFELLNGTGMLKLMLIRRAVWT